MKDEVRHCVRVHHKDMADHVNNGQAMHNDPKNHKNWPNGKAAGMKCVITYTPETQAEDFYAEGADAKLLDFSSGVEVGALFSPEGAVLPELLPGVRDPRP